MYNITVKNNYVYNVVVAATSADIYKNQTVEPNTEYTFNDLGNLDLRVPGMGNLNFLDLGEKKLDGYPLNETWGALVRGHNVEAYYRYEGQGHLIVEIDALGTSTLTTDNGSMIPISLEEMKIVTSMS